MTKPWFRMYRREAGTFAQLPFVARAIFREILCLTDDEGMIFVGNKAPAEAVVFALGADRSDRRAIAKAMDLLLADGCLVHDADVLCAPNFPYFQADAPKPSKRREPTSNVQRTDLDGATNEPRTNHEAATTAQRTDHEPTTKIDLSIGNHTLAQSVLSSDSEIDQIRVEGEKSAGARDPIPPEPSESPRQRLRDPFREHFQVHARPEADRVVASDVETMFSDARSKLGRGKFKRNRHDDARLIDAVEFANEGGTDRESRFECLRITIAGFMADESPGTSSAGWPFAFLAADLGKYHAAGLRLTGSAPVVSPASDPLSLAKAAYAVACERVRASEGTADYQDAVDAKRAAQRALHAAEAA